MSDLEKQFKDTPFEELACLVDCVGDEVGHLVSRGEISLFVDFPEEIRYELLRLGSSINDYVFWVYEEKEWHKALEIESGVSAVGDSPKEALENYFGARFAL